MQRPKSVYGLTCAAYVDTAHANTHSTSISAASMNRKSHEILRFLGLDEGDRVLEINADAGYNARLNSLQQGLDMDRLIVDRTPTVNSYNVIFGDSVPSVVIA